MDFAGQTVSDFTEKLASKAPVPGGGGASALGGALGVSLGAMVGNLTLGKAKYAEFEPEVRELIQKAEALREALLSAIDRDAAAYLFLNRSYALPKEDPGREAAIQSALVGAAEAPLAILRLCCEAIDLHQGLLGKTTVLAASDIGTGAALCRGAMEGAAMNVLVNTKLMTDRTLAEGLNKEVFERMGRWGNAAETIYKQVLEQYK